MTDYKNKVLFLRKSKNGNHLYAFDLEGAMESAENGSLIMNITEVIAVMEGKIPFCKVSMLPPGKDDSGD
jgi:hypothetical protein